MPIASFTLNHDAHITSWSAGAAAWFGYAAAEVLGRHCRFLLTDTVLAEAASSGEGGEDYIRVVPVRLADGDRRDALLTCSPLTGSSGEPGLLCQVSDAAGVSRSDEPLPDVASPHDAVQTAFMDAFVRTSPHGMGILDNDLHYVLVNDVLAAINGMSARDHIGRRVADVVRAADRGEYEKHLRKVLETGEPLHNVLISGRTEKSRDRDRVWSVTFFRLTSEDGEVLGLGGLIVDVTQKQTDLLEASAVRQRLDLVNQAGNKVGTTLEMEETARELAEFVVPDFADLVTVEMRKDFLEGSRFPDGAKAVSTVRLAGRTALDNRTGQYLFSGSGGEHVHAVGSTSHGSLCTGRPWHRQRLNGRPLGDLADDEAVHALRESGLDSVVMAPLVARGRCLGLVTFARSTEREPLDDEDLKVAEELTARTALSLDNARMYDDERRIAVALQRNMLPGEKDIPVRQGLEIGYHYWSTSRSAKVGGDWFDVIPLSGHRIALVVGDMMGHDIQAAAGMGQMRTAMHTLARLDLEPVDLLTRLDNIVDVSPAMQYATCVYAVYNTVTRECSIANAGHPKPVLRHDDRTTEVIPVDSGTPLGIGIGTSDFSVTDLVLPEDSTLVLCTDGLIERRGQDIDTGIQALRSALEEPVPPGFGVQQWCDSIVGKLTDWTDGDDLAVLMARAPAMPQHRSVRWRLRPEPGSASWARSAVRRTLRGWGLDDLQDTVQLLTNELVTNAILHARGEIELKMAMGATLVVEVSDGDERLPHRTRLTSERQWGRGLTLVNEIAQKWGARSITSGKVVWFELPLQS
jgi:PAS domain S-box-containing protein